MTYIALYVGDLVRRSRVETAARDAGLEVVDAGDADLVVLDLSDPDAVTRYREARPAGRAIGFYPHVRRELAEVARSHGIEPYENRDFFEDLPGLLAQASEG